MIQDSTEFQALVRNQQHHPFTTFVLTAGEHADFNTLKM